MFKSGDYVLTKMGYTYYDEALNKFSVFEAGFLKKSRRDYFDDLNDCGYTIGAGFYVLHHKNYFGKVTKENTKAYKKDDASVTYGYEGMVYEDADGTFYTAEQMKSAHPTVFCGAMEQLSRGVRSAFGFVKKPVVSGWDLMIDGK